MMVDEHTAVAWHPKPPGFRYHRFEKSFRVAFPAAAVFQWLNDPATFTDTQIWPFRVEFLPARPGGPADFTEGVFTTHHGPLLNLPSVVGEVRPNAYRDLRYLYGAYALSLRIIRPVRLQFWLQETSAGQTEVRLALDSYVRPGWAGFWEWAQGLFWRSFPAWMRRSLKARTS
jgi:hypothetical protein